MDLLVTWRSWLFGPGPGKGSAAFLPVLLYKQRHRAGAGAGYCQARQHDAEAMRAASRGDSSPAQQL